MFTGLVEDMGTIRRLSPVGSGGLELVIAPDALPLGEVEIGASIAVNGCCLTAETLSADEWSCTAGRETLELTTLGGLAVGDRVHLERALRVGDRLGGHLVQGHVDGMGQIVEIIDAGESVIVWVDVTRDLARYVASKGSLCIDGVSLTVNEIRETRARVNIVPHTQEVTRFGGYTVGTRVNLEVDILAKYVERLLAFGDGLDLSTLKKSGFA